jgi:hypothetical protein
MKKVHFDKFNDGSICCGTQYADFATTDVNEVTCRRCLENSGGRLEELPLWFIGKAEQAAKAAGAAAVGATAGYAAVAAAGLTAAGAVGSGAGIGAAAGPVGVGFGAIAGLAVYGIYRIIR